MSAPAVFTIPAGQNFAKTLAAELLRRTDGRPEDLARMRILLPTRRAGRTLREAFLQLSHGAPLLLPRLQPLGDVDAEELAFDALGAAEDALDIPPAIDPLRRQILLARAIMARGDTLGPAQALALAAELARLIDRIHTEGLDIGGLAGLAGAEFAAHWQITLDFLAILGAAWPAILAEEGVIYAADRRNRLLRAQAERWRAQPPATPVIAAGITGSIPAAAELLQVIAGLPQGAVVLPGLDQAMDDESWDAISGTHPQAAFRQLLGRLGVERAAVKAWAGNVAAPERAWLAREMMRPAETTPGWAALKDDPAARTRGALALRGLMRCDADTPQEEARTIALLLREALETPSRTAALVTPDRDLARRVAAACRRWGLSVDDSAGVPLAATPPGLFLRLVASTAAQNLSPVALLAMLRHDFCRLDLPQDERVQAIAALEITALRGPKPPPGPAGLRRRMADADSPAIAADLLTRIERAMQTLLDALAADDVSLAGILDAHINAAEALAAMPDVPGAETLWTGDDGTAAAEFLAGLREQAASMPSLRGADYLSVLEQLMRGQTVRPAWGTHPRLSILGRLEARLLQADLVILGGLNEGTWPADPGHDPWMSRPMMMAFGLPGPEAAVGLAAHDFVQGFCAGSVVLTRAKRAGGAPAVPARWLQRLDAVLASLGQDPARLLQEGRRWTSLARTLDENTKVSPARRPAPAPPVTLRPRGLSVTQVETWLSDPYQVYARHVLELRKLKPLEKVPDAADRGELLHEVMKDFIRLHKSMMPADARSILLGLGERRLKGRSDDPGFWDFWWPRFERVAEWIDGQERAWRDGAAPLAVEVMGRMTLPGPAGDFTLTARADRIDRLANGALAIIDYKSGGTYSKTRIGTGAAPQLPLEAMILQAGGFEGIDAAPAGYLGYWVLSGAEPPGKEIALKDGLEDAVAAAQGGLGELIALFDDPATPYMSVPDPDRAPRYNDYAQLARLQEWTALGDAAEDAA